MVKLLFIGFATIDFIDGKKYIGGAAGAMSINASKLGIESHLLSVLSSDELGSFYKKKLFDARVHFEKCRLDSPSIPTCIIKDIESIGSKREWNDNGSLPFFNSLTIPSSYLSDFNGIFLCNAPPLLAERVSYNNSNRNIIYIPGPQSVFKEDYIKESVLKNTLIIFGNEEESVNIFKKKPFDYGVSQIVITRGKAGGSVFLPDSSKFDFKAELVKDVVDATGAGDSFALGYGLKYLENNDTYNSVNNGIELATIIIKKKGSI